MLLGCTVVSLSQGPCGRCRVVGDDITHGGTDRAVYLFMAVTGLSDNGAFRNAFCDIYALPARSRGAVAWLPAPGTTGDP